MLLVAAGVGALVAGSQLLIDGAVVIARAIGVSEAVIGLTMIAIGTSLPELTTAVIAALRHHSEIALGNVLGSNMFNILAILPALAMVTPFDVAPEILRFDIRVMAAAALILLPVMFTGWRIGRREGAFFLLIYGLYIVIKYEPAVMAG
jgi:cation:H+ antiporter